MQSVHLRSISTFLPYPTPNKTILCSAISPLGSPRDGELLGEQAQAFYGDTILSTLYMVLEP